MEGLESLGNGNAALEECGQLRIGLGRAGPALVWIYPAYNIFYIIQGSPGSSFTALTYWLQSKPPLQNSSQAATTVPPTTAPPSTIPPATLNFSDYGLSPYSCQQEGRLHSVPGGAATVMYFYNRSSVTLLIIWINYNGLCQQYDTLPPGGSFTINTFIGNLWMIANSSANCLGVYDINGATTPQITITDG
jgi:hypothetical protein